MSYDKPNFPGMLIAGVLHHYKVVVVHALDDNGEELYWQQLKLAGQPRVNEFGLRVIDVYEGSYERAATNILGNWLFDSEITPMSLWDMGVIRHPTQDTWNTRRYTTHLA